MKMKWITNVSRSNAKSDRIIIELDLKKTCLIGCPHSDVELGTFSVTELERMDLVGIYEVVPDDKESEIKPNPNCPDCKGTGIIMLLRFDVPCNCVIADKNLRSKDFPDYNDGYWE